MTAPRPFTVKCRDLQRRIASRIPAKDVAFMKDPVCHLSLLDEHQAVTAITDQAYELMIAMPVGGWFWAVLNLETDEISYEPSGWFPWKLTGPVPRLVPTRLTPPSPRIETQNGRVLCRLALIRFISGSSASAHDPPLAIALTAETRNAWQFTRAPHDAVFPTTSQKSGPLTSPEYSAEVDVSFDASRIHALPDSESGRLHDLEISQILRGWHPEASPLRWSVNTGIVTNNAAWNEPSK